MDSVDAVHAEIGFTAEQAEQLRRVKGFWTGLKRLESIARRDPKQVPAYRSMLERGLSRVGTQQRLSDEAFQRETETYWKTYHDLRKQFQIAEHEARRLPHAMDEWCERWCPIEYRRLCDAFETAIAQGTAESFTVLTNATRELFAAYLGGEYGRTNREPGEGPDDD